MSEPERGRVECYSGHTYAQEPRAVIWQGRRYPVAHVEARWRTPEGPAFRVCTESGHIFDLAYHEAEGYWEYPKLASATVPNTNRQEDEEVRTP